MNKKLILFCFLITVFILSFIGSSFAYYEIEDEWYEMPPEAQKQNDALVDYYNNVYPNEVYIFIDIDGISVDAHADNSAPLSNSLHECIERQSHDTNSNISTLRAELTQICLDYGLDNPNITINSSYGEEEFIATAETVGISMEPTIFEGATLVINKTHDVHVGDIVVADSSEYGSLTKRISKIDGDKIYLSSDNRNGTIERNGKTYSYEGVRTCVDISEIDGVVIDILNNDGVIRI